MTPGSDPPAPGRLRVDAFVLLVLLALLGGPPAGAENRYFATQIAEEVRSRPTDADTLDQRLHCLMATARLVQPHLPREVRRAQAGTLDATELDRSLLDLARLAEERRVLPSLRRVRFLTPRGVPVVGALFAPARPSDRALVFGHGGFGFKESWLDVMEEVSRQTGCWAMAIDFEGCGESGGFSSWQGRIEDFSAAIELLESECGVSNFALGGHSGGGAYPAVCAALEDPRVSVLVLWDCIFDFYDTHLAEGAPDPGGNPAALLEKTLIANEGRRVVPTEIFPSRGVSEHLEEIYAELDATLRRYRHSAAMLGKAQRTRRLAVLHVTAEDVLRPVTPGQLGEGFALPDAPAGPIRRKFLGRPLTFRHSGLFNRPPGMWERWRGELGEPTRFVVVTGTTHAFELPGRRQAVHETVQWLKTHLAPRESR
ncbi:alpha/beta hydrolase [bacterium CPR1]|nr:alpha/beta hydrolase [bacterium CPR1]